ncbi:hypothetical protein CSE899_20528, partial [Cronobacter sakazakii E899]
RFPEDTPNGVYATMRVVSIKEMKRIGVIHRIARQYERMFNF